MNRKLDVAYPCWRFEMWLKGYGSYDDIDKQVQKGELIPFKEYPSKEIKRDCLSQK